MVSCFDVAAATKSQKSDKSEGNKLGLIDMIELDETVWITFFPFVQVDDLEELRDVDICLSWEHQTVVELAVNSEKRSVSEQVYPKACE